MRSCLVREIPATDSGRWRLHVPTQPGWCALLVRVDDRGKVHGDVALDPADLVRVGEALVRAGQALTKLNNLFVSDTARAR